MCTAFAAHMAAALMRSTDRLPIIPAGLSPDDGCGFFRSGRALSITPLSPLRTYEAFSCRPRAMAKSRLWRGFSVRLSGVFPSRPDFRKAPGGVAVNAGRRPPRRGAERGVEGRERGATIWVSRAAHALAPAVASLAAAAGLKSSPLTMIAQAMRANLLYQIPLINSSRMALATNGRGCWRGSFRAGG